MGVRQARADGALSQGPRGKRVSGIHMITIPWGKVEALETHLVLWQTEEGEASRDFTPHCALASTSSSNLQSLMFTVITY